MNNWIPPRSGRTVITAVLTVISIVFCSRSAVSSTPADSDSLGTDRVITLTYEQTRRGAFSYRRLAHPKIGLALSGGGLRGFAQVGVLEVFEENGISVDYIAGSSMGSVVGGLYAIGYTPAELREFALTTDWQNIFSNTPERSTMFVGQKRDLNRHIFALRFSGLQPYIPQALSQGQRIATILNSLIFRASFMPNANFDDFKIPLRIVALDKYAGTQTVFREGNLALSILGSIAAPFLFTEVTINGRVYIDGGIIDNIPTDVARDMGSDIVIAVNCTSPLLKPGEINFPWNQMDHISTIMQSDRNAESLRRADVVITPNLDAIGAYDFNAIPEIIGLGRQKAREILPVIRRKLTSAAESSSGSSPRVTISAIHITGNENIDDEFIASRMTSAPFTPLSESDIRSDLGAIFRTGYFSDVTAVLHGNAGPAVLEIRVTENPVIRKIELRGNTVFTQEELEPLYHKGVNDVFNTMYGEVFIDSVLARYNRSGYSIAQVTGFRLDPVRETVSLTLDEGRLAGIQIIGNKKTKRHVISREMPLRQGDIFDLEKAQRGIQNIYGTGLFQRVYPNFSREDGKLYLQINIEEKNSEIIRFGARYDLEQEVKGFIEFSDDNFGGFGMQSLIHARYGSREEDFHYRFRLDRIFESYFTMNGDIHYRARRDYLTDQNRDFSHRGDFKDTRTGGSISLGSQLGRFGTVSAVYNFDRTKIEAFPAESLPRSLAAMYTADINEKLNIATFTLQSVVDTRDRIPFPRRGNFHEIYYETAGSVWGSEVSYVKFFSSLGYVYTFADRHTVEPRIVMGTADRTLPYAKRFRWGGLHTFFGKRLNGLHGRTFVATNLGYRFKLPLKNIFDSYVTVRWDMVNVVEQEFKFRFADFKNGIGGAFSMDLPVGPLEAGYGKIIGESGRFYFSLGHNF